MCQKEYQPTYIHTYEVYRYIFRRCQWCNVYHRRKWTRRHEFKSWTKLIVIHQAIIPLGKA